MDPYATHLPILEALVKSGDHAVEFGCGVHSTPFLLGRCASLMSVEQSSSAWIEKVREITGSPLHWSPLLALRSDFMAVDYPEKIDVAFVDGLPATRWACVLLMMQMRVPVIIAHDTETEKLYGWSRIRKAGYEQQIHRDLTPWTTVWKRT